LFVNKNWRQTLGWSFEDTQSINVFEKIFPDEEYRHKVLAEMPRDGASWYDVRVTNRDGRQIETTWIALPMNDGTIISLGRDVTEERRREQEKSNLIKQLVDQNNNLTQFSFIASHNLRGPVASILGLLSICDETSIGNEHNRMVVQNLHSVAHRLDEVIKDLMHILDLRAHQPQAKEWIRFDDLMADIKQSLVHQILVAQPQFHEEFHALESIFTVKTYVHSILYNLIANAIKYRRANEPLVIKVHSFADREAFGFSVEDNGCGIDLKKFGNKLFTLYQRFHLEQEGKGLGLFLVKTQVEALSGKIAVESQPGAGTRFTISFPWEGAPALREEEPVLILAPQR
jgi:PAS domain S-box-containing protein